MRWMPASFAALAILAASVICAANAAPVSDEQLLAALSGSDWRQRREAVHELIGLGPQAEDRVHQLLKRNLDHEQRKNVELALQLIRDNRLFGSSLITLHVKNAPPVQVMQAIAAQCAAPLPVSPPGLWKQDQWPPLTLDYDHKPFWEVMNDLSARLGLEYLSTESQSVRITRSSGRRDESVTTSGAFLFTVSAMGARRGMSIDLSVYPEPKVIVLRTLDVKLEKAVDELGNALTPQSGRGFGPRRGFGGGPWGRRSRTAPRELWALFQHPPGNVVADLRGNLKLSVPSNWTRWEVSGPVGMGSSTRTVDGIPISLDSMKPIAVDMYQLQLSIPFGWSQNNTVQQDEVLDLIRHNLRVVDAADRPLAMESPDPRPGASSTEIDVNFSRSVSGAETGPPAKLIWDIPDQTRELLVPFAFKNIPIDDPFN